MFIVRQTERFGAWLSGLSDRMARLRIASRLQIVEQGSLVDWKPLGAGLRELRINYGPGYRLYFTVRDEQVIVLLAGGDKKTQAADIRQARAMLAKL